MRRDENFVAKEEYQLWCNFLHINQEPNMGNGHGSNTFWDKVSEDYNKNKHAHVEILARSMETKWGVIKHDIVKVLQVLLIYGSVG
jgi:hypothetical protein